MIYGVDYYPEHWPEARWETDADLMKAAGINTVRLAEFSWAKLESSKGHYDFSWLDKAISVLASRGIKVVIGTPTAAPPKWLMDKHPDICMRDKDGHTRDFGTRRHYCYNNKTYRKYTRRIVAKLAEHLGDSEAVVAWQIDNEFGCHDTVRCYCDNCLDAFRSWLKKKYGTIEALNEAWGTVFWSQTYRDWKELILPRKTVCEDFSEFTHNPGMLLDYMRFASDSVVDYLQFQAEILRERSRKPITHNMMGHFDNIDYFKFARSLDFVSWDNYVDAQWFSYSYHNVAMAHDLMRGAKEKNFWVMEEQSGPCGWGYFGNTPKPGQLRLWAYQAVAHGAEGILYFRWRACTFGMEQYWYGILDHDGRPRRRYAEIQATGEEMQRISDLVEGSRNVAEVAIIKSYDNLWSHQIQRHNSSFDYNTLLMDYYTALQDNNVGCDVVSPAADLSKYKLVLMPSFNLVDRATADRAREYVLSGGTLVLSFRSGTRNWNNAMTTESLPGVFREIAGVEVEEFDSLNGGRRVPVDIRGQRGMASMWCDVLKTDTADALGVYAGEYYRGACAISTNRYGAGRVYYIGCDLDSDSLKSLMRAVCDAASVAPAFPVSVPGVEFVAKAKGSRTYIFVLNHNDKDVDFELTAPMKDRISGMDLAGKVVMRPYGVLALTP